MGVLEVPFTLFSVLVAEIWISIMLTEIHFRFEFILRVCKLGNFSDLSETESTQAFPSKTADGSVTHKEGGDLESPLCAVCLEFHRC
ncbi:hypothetical protein OIU76_006621 [Salix suchowensis]|nr:hypothetical protein OIU76_006621 [Salix suchowensis]